jgi:predicted ATPase
VLDNWEHVVDSAASLAETVLRMCPHTTVLATSREPLRIEGEHLCRVSPLNVPSQHPAEPCDILEHSAVQLFIARMTALRPDFSAEADLPQSLRSAGTSTAFLLPSSLQRGALPRSAPNRLLRD